MPKGGPCTLSYSTSRSDRSYNQDHTEASHTTRAVDAPTPPHLLPCPPERALKCIPLPPQVPGITTVLLHPALAASGAHLRGVDFASSAAQIQRAVGRRVSDELATQPALPSLTVLFPRLPWAITVHGQWSSSGRVLRCVTVSDVLSAIHRALLLLVDEGQLDTEVAGLGMTQSGAQCPRGGHGRAGLPLTSGDGQGMTRLDLLQGKTSFRGLSPSEMGCDVWILEVA
ncbi:hypothetical protein FB45DRAFT_751174 [Roridomyces roridus]|uniref:DUF6699 domain-containing protein n=1 Tax=Roridomyces roridus TaxID=1738132 RepID=A0AAD7BLV6_9AGAR|nr:hypothetical protein FB45DRAFT_751174 [Roridomyces roridus]